MTVSTGFGERLREARLAANKTQLELASACDVYPATANRWERGGVEPSSISIVVKAAEFLGVSVGWLVNAEGPGPRPTKPRRRRAV